MVEEQAAGGTSALASSRLGTLLKVCITVFVVAGAAWLLLAVVAQLMGPTEPNVGVQTGPFPGYSRSYLIVSGVAGIARSIWTYSVGAMLALIGVMLYRSLGAGLRFGDLVKGRRALVEHSEGPSGP